MISRSGTGPITLLRDIDQPYVFEVSQKAVQYRLEFYDTESPENLKALRPDIVILCYDISQRLSLVHMQRFVQSNLPLLLLTSRLFSLS